MPTVGIHYKKIAFLVENSFLEHVVRKEVLHDAFKGIEHQGLVFLRLTFFHNFSTFPGINIYKLAASHVGLSTKSACANQNATWRI